MSTQEENEEEGNSGATPAVPFSSQSGPQLIDRIERYAGDPMQYGLAYICARCGRPSEFTDPAQFCAPPKQPTPAERLALAAEARQRTPAEAFGIGVERERLHVCDPCFDQLLLLATPAGRRAVDFEIEMQLPQQIRDSAGKAEFGSFRTSGRYAQHLADIRGKVVDWCRDTTRLGPYAANSLYLFGERGGWGPGNGCGKTHLAVSAMKYIARRKASLLSARNGHHLVNVPCRFICLEYLVDNYLRMRRESGSSAYKYSTESGVVEGSFNDFIEYLAQVQYLFLDDVGCGGPRQMVEETYSRLFETRAGEEACVFVTSNFKPERLSERIGGRAASRMFRGAETQVVQVKAPDYSLMQVNR